MKIFLKSFILVPFFLLLIAITTGCIPGITTPDIISPSISKASIISFDINSFEEGKIELKWEIDGDYDEILLSRKEIDESYVVLERFEDTSQSIYSDINLDNEKIYIYKLEIKLNGVIQDIKKYSLFSSPINSNGAIVIYNIALNDSDNHQFEVEMWVNTKGTGSLSLKTESYLGAENTLKIINWDSEVYNGAFLSGNPDTGINISAEGISLIRYKAELPPISSTDIHGILGLFTDRFFIAAGSQHLLLIDESDKEKISKIYKIYNTNPYWNVLSPEYSQEDKVFIIDFSDIDGNYFAYQEDTVLSYPEGTFYTEDDNIYGTEFTITLDKSISGYSGYTDKMFKIFENICSIFGEGVGERYCTFVVYYNSEVYSSENTYSQGFSQGFGIVDEMYAHQIFHRWNGWEPYETIMVTPSPWHRGFYSEGWNNYFIDWNLNQVKPGFSWDYLKKFYNTYKSEYYGTIKDIPVANEGGDTFIYYRKGACAAYVLNKEIENQTGGEVSLVEVQREIWERYGHEMGTFDYNDIIDIINELTDSDFSEFFNNYVFGKKEIIIPEFE